MLTQLPHQRRGTNSPTPFTPFKQSGNRARRLFGNLAYDPSYHYLRKKSLDNFREYLVNILRTYAKVVAVEAPGFYHYGLQRS